MKNRTSSFLLKGLVTIILILGYVLIQEFLNPLMLTRIALIFAVVIHPSEYIVFALMLILALILIFYLGFLLQRIFKYPKINIVVMIMAFAYFVIKYVFADSNSTFFVPTEKERYIFIIVSHIFFSAGLLWKKK
ncbi:hypothetical protein JMUB3936_1263 [Leptotrichia wadei]|uniref:Uncharacterized protein n=1 Tax=Leptotrichia wadei TaxID=157687 RepID=A0A510KTE0_9FUSO|nr:hypothetical protein [Leptotrichia wadei]BBM54979.1 hypothetical protein JMUB3936_1263 [Leptotrichia wadei]